MNSGLISDNLIMKDFQVYQHELRVFDVKAYDLSSLSNIDLGVNFERYTFEFWNTVIKPYNRISGNLAESTGFYQLTFN